MAEFVDESEMEELGGMLTELLDSDSGLRDNEIDFLDSLVEWEGSFTIAQASWLRKIYRRLFP